MKALSGKQPKEMNVMDWKDLKTRAMSTIRM